MTVSVSVRVRGECVSASVWGGLCLHEREREKPGKEGERKSVRVYLLALRRRNPQD